ncbi:hypothetical protein GCM10008965_19010 [Methylorubrum aminovorans]|nr:hypothetical protein GCM10025880_51900 [Methylorubrum aminovorans]
MAWRLNIQFTIGLTSKRELPQWQTFAHTTRLAGLMADQHLAGAAHRVAAAGQRIKLDRHCVMRLIERPMPGTVPRSMAHATTSREAEP